MFLLLKNIWKRYKNMSDKYSKEDAYQTIDLINSWINNVDTKTSFALAYVAVLMGFAFANGTSTVFQEAKNTCPLTCGIIFKLILVLMLYGASVGAIINLFMAVIARVKNDSGKKSMMFFGSISQMSINDYKAKILNMDEKDIIKDLLEQIHTNSRICMKKIKRYNKGIVYLIIATIICFVSVAFGII